MAQLPCRRGSGGGVRGGQHPGGAPVGVDHHVAAVDPLEVQGAGAAVDADEAGHELVGRGGEDLLRGAHLGDDPAGLQDHHAVADEEGLVDVVGDEDDGLAQLPLQALQLELQLAAHDRVDGPEGLVHQQDVRVRGEAAGHPDALLLAAGQLSGVARCERGIQADRLHQLLGAGAGLALRGAAQHGHGGDVVQHRAVREQPGGLHDVADAAAQLHRVEARDVVAVDVDPARGGLDHAVDHAHQGRLAGAGGAHQHHGLVGGDLQAEVLDRDRAAGVLLADVLESDHRASQRRRADERSLPAATLYPAPLTAHRPAPPDRPTGRPALSPRRPVRGAPRR
jgi:hypothetical protein